MTIPLPPRLVDAAISDGRESWLAALPALVAAVQEQWSLAIDAPFEPGGHNAWVAPVRDAHGTHLVLKVAWRHPEADHDVDGLRFWNGDGTVWLLDAQRFPDTDALLLERCQPGVALDRRPEDEQDRIIAALLARLWRAPPADASFRPLAAMCDQWADEFEQRAATTQDPPIDPGLARAGIELFRALPATAPRHVLLCTDLHAGNVLAARREPWLVIDPKPHVGDPTYDLLQHLLNCEERLRADPRGLARRMADLTAVDPDRLLLWLFARCVQESPGSPHLAQVAHRIAPHSGDRKPERANPGFVIGSLLWGMVADGSRPHRFDVVGALICLGGVAVIMYAR